MRIFAYACTNPDPPVRRGVLPLTELTILLGPNDSGKSTYLRAVERDLRGGHVPTSDDRSEYRRVGVFYAHLTAKEMVRVFDEALGARAGARGLDGFAGIRPPWDDGLWRVGRDAARDLSFPGGPDVGQHLADELATDHPERLPVLNALAGSDIVAFEPAGERSGRLWNVYWCLPPLEDQANTIAQELRDSSLRFFEDKRTKDAGGFVPMRGPYAMSYPRPDHLLLEGAPVAVVAVGQVQRFPMPTSLAVPASAASIQSAVTEAISLLADAARYGPGDVRAQGELSQEERSERRPPGGWLAQEGDAYRVDPDVIAACAFIHEAANRLLPAFIAERYELIVEAEAIGSWFSQPPLRLLIHPHGGEQGDDFGLDEVADGLRLWMQLALLEAAEQTGRIRSYLYELASDWIDQEEAGGQAAQNEDPDADELLAAAKETEERFHLAVEDLRRISEVGHVSGELAQRLAVRPSEEIFSREAQDRRLFVVDEPERHLHPRLQREAARWLARTANERAAPALLASHSTAFLSLPATEGVSYLYCSRADDRAELRRFTLAELQDLDRVGGEMGFDRGELLATVALFLMVEGRHDAEVLTRVFRSDLADAHIAVVPIGGASQAAAVLDSEALWRYTSAKVAIATDKFTPERFKQLLGNEQELKALRKSNAPEETKGLATLMGNARHQGKTIELLGHAEDDLIDALDEDVVKELFPKYPGHQDARRLWSEAQQRENMKAKQKKSFYEQHFGLPNDVRTYQQLGDALAGRGRRPPALAKIVADAVALASTD